MNKNSFIALALVLLSFSGLVSALDVAAVSADASFDLPKEVSSDYYDKLSAVATTSDFELGLIKATRDSPVSGSLIFSYVPSKDLSLTNSDVSKGVSEFNRFTNSKSVNASSGIKVSYYVWETITETKLVNVPYLVDVTPKAIDKDNGTNSNTQPYSYLQDDYSLVTNSFEGWVKLDSSYSLSGSKNSKYLIKMQADNLDWKTNYDLVPCIGGKCFSQFAFINTSATLEVNTTVNNPAGVFVNVPVIHVSYNQTQLSGQACARGNVTFVANNASGQYALNTENVAFFWNVFNDTNGYFNATLRLAGMPAGQSTITILCGAASSENRSAVYKDFSWIYLGDLDFTGALFADASSHLLNSTSNSTNVAPLQGSAKYLGGGFNHTSDSALALDFISNAINYNASGAPIHTDNLMVCRMNFWKAPSTGSNSKVFYDQGGGYMFWDDNTYNASQFGMVAYDRVTAKMADTNIVLNQWRNYAGITRYNGTDTMAWLVDGVLNSSSNGVTSVVSGTPVYLGSSSVSLLARAAFQECGFISGQPKWINESWVSIFHNDTSQRQNYTVNTGAVTNSSPAWTSAGTTPANKTVWSSGLSVTFKVSWNDTSGTETFNLDGTNTTMGSVNTNLTTTKLAAGYHTWYAFNVNSAGAYNQTDTFVFYLQPANGSLSLLLNSSAADLTMIVGLGSNSSVPSVNTAYGVTVSLYRNGTLIQSATVPPQLNNYTTENTLGTFNITAVFAGDANYTKFVVSRNINVVTVIPTPSSSSATGTITPVQVSVIFEGEEPNPASDNTAVLVSLFSFVGIVFLVAVLSPKGSSRKKEDEED